MGQKVHPLSFRLGYIRTWSSKWFAHRREYADLLNEDIKVRKYVKKEFYAASISKIEIARSTGKVRVGLYTARPGVIIGRRGSEIDRLREDLQNITKKEVQVDIKEIKNPNIEAQLVSENIAFQLEKRIAFRRAMKRAVQLALTSGAKGIKIACKGRLGGAEIARKEEYKQGKVPLQTLRADIDYGFAEAYTTYGTIGVKVWIYKGDAILDKKELAQEALAQT
ncbi:MAG: 30S ribosomal protein S3 [Candidatus Omnitrophica bacterium]|nr:30S ribosomal protein S3 [Candidatus Omnitrophota bacterium]